MALLTLESATAVVYISALICSTVSGQTCSSDAFLDPKNVDSYDSSRLVPLLGRYETNGREQWIFFDLQFTCRGMLTKWIFRGLPDQDIGVELTTWRLNTRSNFFTSYDQVSTTERNAGMPIRSGAVFTYELISPVEVLPGDVVGVEMGFISFGGTSNNIIALNTSWSGSTSRSYRTSGSGPSFVLQSPSNIRETDIVPFLQAVIEPLQESTVVMELPTDSPRVATTTVMDLSTDLPSVITTVNPSTDMVQTINASTMMTPPTIAVASPDPDPDNERRKSIVAITAGVCGGITAILIIAVSCVCIACITKRVQVHVHYNGESSDGRHQENTPNSSGTLVQMNAAYRRAVATNNMAVTVGTSNGHSLQYNLAYGSQNQVNEVVVMEIGSVRDYESMSGYTAYRHGNPTHREEEGICSHMHMALPTGEYYDDNEHSYEYIQ